MKIYLETQCSEDARPYYGINVCNKDNLLALIELMNNNTRYNRNHHVEICLIYIFKETLLVIFPYLVFFLPSSKQRVEVVHEVKV